MSDREFLERLHRARLTLASVDAEVARSKEGYEAENAPLFQKRELAQIEVMEADEGVRKQAIRILQETGDKNPMPGVTIKLMPQPLDYDETDALGWAKKHDMALALDKKRFEALVRGDPDTFRGFVTIADKVPRPFIVGDLGPVLDGMTDDVTPAP